MGFRNKIKIRFLLFLVAAISLGGGFALRQIVRDFEQGSDIKKQSGQCSTVQTWITRHVSEFILEQRGNSPFKQASENGTSRVQKYFLTLKSTLVTLLLNNTHCGQRVVVREQSDDWNQTSLVADSLNQLNALIILLVLIHTFKINAAERKIRKAIRSKTVHNEEKCFLTSVNTVLSTFFSSFCPFANHLNDKCEDDDLEFKQGNKYTWMDDPFMWIGRFTKYLSFSVLDRVASYRPLSSPTASNPTSFISLAEAGFRYSGVNNTVECQGCRKLVNIADFHSPAVEAAYHNEGCSYIKVLSNMLNDKQDVETDSSTQVDIERATLNEDLSTNNNDNSRLPSGTQQSTMTNELVMLNQLPNGVSSPLTPLEDNLICSDRTQGLRSESVSGCGDMHKHAVAVGQQSQQDITQVQQLSNHSAEMEQQIMNQILAVEKQQTSQVHAMEQQQRNQASSVEQQKTVEQQLTNHSFPIEQQQTNQASSVEHQQTNQAFPVEHQQTNLAFSVEQQQTNQPSALEQQQNHSSSHSEEMGACAVPGNPAHSASDSNSLLFDRKEVEAEHYNSNSLETNRDHCEKNPGHFAYTSISELQLDKIPSNVRTPEVLKFIQKIGKLVVKIVVRSTSQKRPCDDDHQQASKYRFGTGMAMTKPADEDPAVNTERIGKWNTVRKYLPIKKNKGTIYIQTNRHLVFDDYEAQHTLVEFFYDNPNRRGIVFAKGVSIEHGKSLGDFKSTLKCKISDLSMIEFVKNTENEILNLSQRFPQSIKEGLLKRVFVIAHPHGGEKVLSYGDHVMVKYALKIQERNGQPWPDMVKINNYTQIAQNADQIRKVMFYTADTCKGSSGGVVISFKKTKHNNVEDIVLDLWMHNGVSKNLGLNASVMRELTSDDIANHGTPSVYRSSVQDDQEMEANSAANQVVSCPVYTVMGSPAHPAYAIYRKRLGSYPNPFNHVHTAVDLADAGFFFANYGDCVRCFHCGLGLRSWRPGDSIHEEHFKNRPDCQFLQMKLKASGIDQLQFHSDIQPPTAQTLGFVETVMTGETAQRSENENQPHQQPKVTRVVQSSLPPATQNLQHEPRENSQLQPEILNQLTKFVPNNQREVVVGMVSVGSNQHAAACVSKSTQVQVLEREQHYLKQLLICKVCFMRPVKDLFLPCGELVACLECSKILTHCPSCQQKILATVTTYFS